MTTYDKGVTFRLDNTTPALITAFASPPPIGATAASTGNFTTVTATTATVATSNMTTGNCSGTFTTDSLTVDTTTVPEFAIGSSTNAFNLDCRNSNVQSVTMTDNVPISGFVISNPKDGQTINLFIKQGAGAYTLGWPTNFKWPGGVAGTISTTNNATDLLVMTYRAATAFWYCTLLKAFA